MGQRQEVGAANDTSQWTDCLGLLLAVVVTAASVQDRNGAHPLLALLRERFSTISLAWADGGYAGRLIAWTAQALHLTVTVVKRTEDMAGFVWGSNIGFGL